MDVLILGGTRFLGRYLVEAAQARGHKVTIFHRGHSVVEPLPDDVERLYGDRDGNLKALEGRHWDVVVDTSGYVPRVVEASAKLLADAVDHYTFISTCSVYSDLTSNDIDEQSPVVKLEDESIEDFMSSPEAYGGLKLLCERVVEKHLPGRTLIIRPGLIVGPFDNSDRFTYWPYRIAQGGEVLAPDNENIAVQFIDVRDLAEWTIKQAEQRTTGIYNTTGPDRLLTIGEVLYESKRITGSDAHFTWVSEQFLHQNGVEPYVGMPLWVPREWAGFSAFNTTKAQRLGLTYRPLAETIQATLEWKQAQPQQDKLRAGLTPEREQELLQKWHAEQA